MAILKLENKFPSHETFDELDLKVCAEFARQEIRPRISGEDPDLQVVINELGPLVRGKPTEEQYRRAFALRKQRPDIKVATIAAWLHVNPHHLPRKQKQLESRAILTTPGTVT